MSEVEGSYYGRGLEHNLHIRITREPDDEDGLVYRVEATLGGSVGTPGTGTWYFGSDDEVEHFIKWRDWGSTP